MFNVRFGYYLGAICIFSIILWYDGIKNTLFRKNNTRLHILSGMIGILIITLPAIFLIFNLPPTYNRIIKTVTGEVVKRQCIGTGYLNGLAAYSIILDDKDTNKIYNFPNENELDNYLFIMTRNIILNIFKHQQIEREYQEGYLEKTVLHELIEGEDALNNIYYEEMLLVVRLTLEKMPERRRLIFELSRFKGLSYKEIAEKLNVSIRTVEHQVYLALIELKKVLLFLFFLFSFK